MSSVYIYLGLMSAYHNNNYVVVFYATDISLIDTLFSSEVLCREGKPLKKFIEDWPGGARVWFRELASCRDRREIEMGRREIKGASAALIMKLSIKEREEEEQTVRRIWDGGK